MKTFFKKGYLTIGKRNGLEWVRVINPFPKGIIFVPPLIGGNLSQQVSSFRWLIRRQYDLISFNYSGHGHSSDKFSLGATVRDTLHMLRHTSRLSQEESLPLYGIASCYSAIPLLYAAHCLSEPFKRLVLINAITELGTQPVIKSFLTYYRMLYPNQNNLQMLLAAFEQYVDFLFPGIIKGKDNFGVLKRKRTRLLKVISEFFILNPLEGIYLKHTPVLCLYACKDRILKIYNMGVKVNYENDIRRRCPQALFHYLDDDHFFSLPNTRDEAMRSIISFLKFSLR